MCNKVQTVAPLFGQAGLEEVEIQPKSKLSFPIGQACFADELIVLSSSGTSQHDLIKLHDPNLRLATKKLGLYDLEGFLSFTSAFCCIPATSVIGWSWDGSLSYPWLRSPMVDAMACIRKPVDVSQHPTNLTRIYPNHKIYHLAQWVLCI